MPKSPVATQASRVSNLSNKEGAAAGELALKAHVLGCNPEILAEMTEGDRMMREIGDMVDLTEAPEDAVCTLVIDLLQYCEQEKIDWTQDVMSRAWERFRMIARTKYKSDELPEAERNRTAASKNITGAASSLKRSVLV